MANKSVAVLDVRSSEVAVFVGERGLNKTFVFKASRTENYHGYQDGEFIDVEQLSRAIHRAITAVEQVCGERLRMLYVGVPGEFTKVVSKEQDIGFPKKRKVTERDLNVLFNAGKQEEKNYRFMRVSSMIYVTNDKQKVVDPVGISTTGLSGCVSYFYCAEYFCSTIEDILKDLRISTKYLPTNFAMASYVIPSETRDECALFLDAGFLSSTVSIVLGNGIMAQHTFWAGRGQIAGLIIQKLGVPYEVALNLLTRCNPFAKQEGGVPEKTEIQFRGASYEYSPALLAEAVEEGLDNICEAASEFFESFDERKLDYKPLYVTGEGICDIRGALEHLAKRLNRIVESVAPDLPYYNKPAMSSRVALCDMASEDNRKSGFFQKLFHGFGG